MCILKHVYQHILYGKVVTRSLDVCINLKLIEIPLIVG